MNINKKNVFIVNDQPALTDIVERNSIRQVGKVITSEQLSQIKTNSLDFVIIMIGIHHYEKEYLEMIMDHVNRILRKGGKFIIREHHADKFLMHRVHCAHIIFNAITGVSDENEKNEYRNFHTVPEWRNYIKQFGFEAFGKYFVQKNDPTEDYMITFIKTHNISLQTEYELCLKRSFNSTLFTLPEWYTVQFIQKYGEFLETIPYYEFPYWHCTKTYLKLMRDMTKKSIKEVGYKNTFLSDGFMMDTIVGSIFITQMMFLSAVSFVPRQLYKYVKEDRVLHARISLKNDNNYDDNHKPFEEAISQNEKLIEDGLKILSKNETDEHTEYIIEMKRYKPFYRIVRYLISKGAKIHDVAGHNRVQIKFLIPENRHDEIMSELLVFGDFLTEYSFYESMSHKEVSFLVGFDKFEDLFEYIDKENIPVVHMFDY